VLGLDNSPVAVTCSPEPLIEMSADRKVRICRAILQAADGEILQLDRKNNACFGAAWHLGFMKLDDPKIKNMVRKFVVEGEKLFSSYEALDKLISQMDDVPDNSRNYFGLAPLEKAEFKPLLVLFVVNPEAACRLLTFATFNTGIMPRLKVGGPTCRLAIMYPLTSGEVNLSFYDYTARKMCNVEKDKLIISFPYKNILQMIADIDRCSAGTAKIEFPAEFREFLQKRLAAKR
jgi:uncharacterized protein (DUF169 family)